jgi:hypothetical protein
VLTLSYGDGEVGPPFRPVRDDSITANLVTAKREDGGEATAERTTGPRSTQDPPDGIGLYDRDDTFNVATDEQLPNMAGHWLNHGTQSPRRYPVLRVNVRGLSVRTGGEALVGDALDLVRGDRVLVTDPPDWLAGEDVDQLLLGRSERIDQDEWLIDWHTTPAGPYTVGTYQSGSPEPGPAEPARYASAGCEVVAGLVLPGTSGDYASTPDAAVLDITGDIDMRALLHLPHGWVQPGGESDPHDIVSKYVIGTDQRSYSLFLVGVTPNLGWSEAGSDVKFAAATEVPTSAGVVGLRATLDADNGASGRTVTFYTLASGVTDLNADDTLWTQLGDPVVQAGATSIHAGTAPLEVGSREVGTADFFVGTVLAMQVRDGIAGTVVASADFAAQAEGTTSFSDSAGNTWTVHGDAEILHPVSGTSTALTVVTTLGPAWTTDTAAVPLDLRVAGVRPRVTAIAAESNGVQVLTIEQTPVNGVNKTIPAGSDVQLWTPARYGL